MYLLIVIPVCFIVLLTVVRRLEKGMVWPYGNLEVEPQYADVRGYGARWVADATRAGFYLLGWAPDVKGAIYEVSYAFLVSPNRDHLVVIGVGAVLKAQVRGTWIYTLANDEQLVYSTDNQSCVHFDVSRKWRTQLVFTDNFSSLLRRHEVLVQQLGISPRSFPAGRELETFKQMREEHYRLMARSGLIAFTDASATRWHYSIYASLKWSVLNYSIGLLRALTRGRIPRCA